MDTRKRTAAVAMLVSLSLTFATTSFGLDQSLRPKGGSSEPFEITPLPPEEPDEPDQKPRRPESPYLVSRTDTSLHFRWVDKSSYELGYDLYRGPSYSGPWTHLAAWGPSPGVNGTMEYTDSGLSRDTQYWYQVRAYNAYGESSFIQTFATIDGRGGIWRAQLRLRTANVTDAGTDDSVHVTFNDFNGTWVDYGSDDFERGNDFTYDLLLDNVSELSDINDIYIWSTGTDGWCIEELSLLINNTEIFNQHFGSTPSTCRWIDKDNGEAGYLFITRPMLRAHPLWQSYQQPAPPLSLLRDELESRIESMIGDAIHYESAHWGELDGDRYVEVSRLDDQAVRVTVDLVAEVTLAGVSGPDAEVDLQFDLRFSGSCTDGQAPLELHIAVENVQATADFDWLMEFWNLWLINFAEGEIADRVVDAFPDLTKTITLETNESLCITPQVQANHSVALIPSVSPRTDGTPTTRPGIHGASATTFVETASTGGTFTTQPGTVVKPTVLGTSAKSPTLESTLLAK